MPAFAAENYRDRLDEESNPTWRVGEVVKDLTHEGFLTVCRGSRADALWHQWPRLNHHSLAHQRILCDAAEPGVHPDAYRRSFARSVVAS